VKKQNRQEGMETLQRGRCLAC